jgi:starvation-inducible outer membrane lipoprotein
MFVEVPTHKLTYQRTHVRFYGVRSEAPVTCVSSVTVQGTGQTNAMHGRSRFGGAIIANQNLKQSNRLNVMKGHVERRNGMAVVSGVDERVTGRASVMHVFRDADCMKTK